jgi:hypothetical protein
MKYEIMSIVPRMKEDEELMAIELDGIKGTIWMSMKQFNETFLKSAINIPRDSTIETKLSVLAEGHLVATISNHTAKEEYPITQNSTLFRTGAWRDGMEVIRKGKTITLKKGEKAMEGDIGFVEKDGLHIDYEYPVVFRANAEKLMMERVMIGRVQAMARMDSLFNVEMV